MATKKAFSDLEELNKNLTGNKYLTAPSWQSDLRKIDRKLTDYENKKAERENKISELENSDAFKADLDSMRSDLENLTSLKSKSETKSGYLYLGDDGKVQSASDRLKNLAGSGYNSISELSDVISKKKTDISTYEREKKRINYELDALKDNMYSYYSKKSGVTKEELASSENKVRNSAIPQNIFTKVGNNKYFMTDDEVSIYNYYLSKENDGLVDKGTAQSYLDSIEDSLNQRYGSRLAEDMNHDDAFNTAVEIAFGNATGTDSYISGTTNAIAMEANPILDKVGLGMDVQDSPSALQYAGEIVREDLSDVGPQNVFGLGKSLGQMGYDITNTASNMLPSIAMSAIAEAILPGSGAVVGNSLMGLSAAGNEYQNMLYQGYSEEESKKEAELVGLSEALLEYAIGGIGRLGGSVITGSIKKTLTDGIKNATRKAIAEFGLDLASEGIEEGVQEALAPYIKAYVTGEIPKTASFEDIAYAALLGAINAGLFNGGNKVVAGIGNTVINANTKKTYGSSQNELVEEGLASAEGTESNTLAQEYKSKLDSGKDLSGKELRNLVNANEKAIVDEDIAEISKRAEERLKTLGETDNAKELASLIAKSVAGEKLTNKETRTLNNGKYTNRVLNELNPENIKNDNYTTKWAGDINTNRVNSAAYSVNSEIANNVVSWKYGMSNGTVANKMSGSGKTVITSNTSDKSENATIKKIKSISNGKMMLEMSDGTVVNSKDVKYGTQDEVLAYETVRSEGFSVGSANAIIQSLNAIGNKSVSQYMLGVTEAYNYGRTGYKLSDVKSNGFINNLTETEKQFAYDLGKYDATLLNNEAVNVRDNAKSNVVVNKHGKVTLVGSAKATTGRQGASLAAIGRVVANVTHNNVVIFESVVNEEGKRVFAQDVPGTTYKKGKPAPHGVYDPTTGTIYLDINAGENGEGTMLWTFSHELTHYIRQWSPEKFKVLADFLFEEYGGHGINTEVLINNQIAKARRNGRLISRDTAYEEVVADSMSQMLTDTDALEKVEKLKRKDKNLVEKIKSIISNIIARIKGEYEKLDPQTPEALYVKNMKDSLERLSDLFAEALVDASENFEQVQIDKLAEANNMLLHDRYVEPHIKDLSKKYDASSAEIDLDTLLERYNNLVVDWRKISEKLNSKFLNDWNNQEYKNRAFTVFKAQQGYKLNIELASMCKKGIPLFEAIDQIVSREVTKQLNTKVIGKAEKEILYDILKKRGFDIPCAICYVEQARQREGVIIDAFLNGKVEKDKKGNVTKYKIGWNQLLDTIEKEMSKRGVDYSFTSVDRSISTDNYEATAIEMSEHEQKVFYDVLLDLCNKEIVRYNRDDKPKNPKSKIKSANPKDVNDVLKGSLGSNFKIFKILFNDINSRFKIDEDLLYSSATTKNLAMLHPELYSLFNSQGGVSGYKTKQRYVVYLGDILSRTWTSEETREEGGIRNQSNSDFMMYTLLDQAQMYIDLSAKGYYLHAYTKVLAELKLFGLSGAKINASLIPLVHVYMNSDGSIDWAKTQKYAGLDENGNPIYDDIEGVPHNEAFMLLGDSEYSKNISGICIGYSDAHILKLLDDPKVQEIIGFHDKTDNPDKRYKGAKYAKNYNGLNEAIKIKGDGTSETVHIGFNQFVIKAEKKFKKNSKGEFVGEIDYNGKHYTSDDIPMLAADLYKEYCESKGYIPAYHIYAEDFNGNKMYMDEHPNYYKLLGDFGLKNSEGKYAPHRKVQFDMPSRVPYLDAKGNKKTMDSAKYIKQELEKELKVRDDIANALADTSEDGIIPRFVKEVNKLNNKKNEVLKHSLRIQHTNGTFEVVENPAEVSREEVRRYLNDGIDGRIKDKTYVPLGMLTPDVIVDSVRNAGIMIDKLPLIMPVAELQRIHKKSTVQNEGIHNDGHDYEVEKILAVLDSLYKPTVLMVEDYGDRLAIFVQLNDSEKESFAVIHFEPDIGNNLIEGEGEERFNAVVTMYDPDTERKGKPFDYYEDIMKKHNGYEIEIINKGNESATNTWRMPPNVANSSPLSEDIVSPKKGDVNISDRNSLPTKQRINYDYNLEQTEVGSPLRTMAYTKKTGGNIERMGGIVGKNLGSAKTPWVYFHRQYLQDAIKVANIDANEYSKAFDILKKQKPNLAKNFNHVTYNANNKSISFGYSQDFDTAREPVAGEQLQVFFNDGHTIYTENNKKIFHHKWLWVENDYKGFDVNESWEWSKQWLNAIRPTKEIGGGFAPKGIADGTNIDAWNRQLEYFNLPLDGDTVEENLRQEHTSAGTSINSDKIPALYTNKNAKFVNGGINIDIGAGKFDTATDYLKSIGVKSYPFDPFNRTKKTNLEVVNLLKSGKKADTATCSNVLNVIDTAKGRENVILQMAKAIKPEGTAYFTVYENKKNLEDGKAGESSNKPDQWQEFRAAKTYVEEIKKYFNNVSDPKSGLIIAKSPKENLPKAIWQISDVRGTVGETTDEFLKYSDRNSAPTFYSHMSNVIDDIKPEKMGANGVVYYLKGKGVKDEEIKWSGINAFLDGKKSVTKAELQEFAKGSMLQIQETTRQDSEVTNEFIDAWRKYIDWDISDDDIRDEIEKVFFLENTKEYLDKLVKIGDLEKEDRKHLMNLAKKVKKQYTRPTKWSGYKTEGGSNYREILFKMPNSMYSNTAMMKHWEEPGVLAHARIQDFVTPNGKMLFVEEIQSDWHNEGNKIGYKSELGTLKNSYNAKMYEFYESKEFDDICNEYFRKKDRTYNNSTDLLSALVNCFDSQGEIRNSQVENYLNIVGKERLYDKKLQSKISEISKVANEIRKYDETKRVPTAPYSNGKYIEYVMKRLIRMAAEQGYDSIGWTTGAMQEARWDSKFAEGYRIEYDQDIPKFINKYGKQWGIKVDKTVIDRQTRFGNALSIPDIIEFYNEDIESYKNDLSIDPDDEFALGGLADIDDRIENLKGEYEAAKVWSFTLPESSKKDVLTKGQPLYSDRETSESVAFTNKVLYGTQYSSGGMMESGLEYKMLKQQFAVEIDEKVALVHVKNHDTKVFAGDIDGDALKFDMKKYADGLMYAHFSPVCHNFSKAKHNRKESPLDIASAKKVAKDIRETQLPLYTIENAPDYAKSESVKYITDELESLGYKVRKTIYNSADYGSATSRERLIIVAVRSDLELPDVPKKQKSDNSWDKVTRDLWDGLKNSVARDTKTPFPPSMLKAMRNTPKLNSIFNSNGTITVDKPLLIVTTNTGGAVTYAWEGELCPTLTTLCREGRLVLPGENISLSVPNDNIKRVTPQFMGSIQGLPKNFDYGKDATTAFTIVGNGIPTHLTKAVIGGALESVYRQTHNGEQLYSDRNNVGYHAGDLGKAEPLSSQGYSRGTGHFGTGTYFVGEKKKIEGYNRRNGKDAPIETVDFSKYNLYKVTYDSLGYDLHDFLRGVDGFYDIDEKAIRTESEWERRKDKLDLALFNEEISEEDAIKEAKILFGSYNFGNEVQRMADVPEGKWIGLAGDGSVSLIDQVTNEDIDIPESELSKYVNVFDVINRLIYDNRYAPRIVSRIEGWDDKLNLNSRILFDMSKQEVLDTIEEVRKDIATSTEDKDVSDSAATRFMKKLGYEGIDVRGTGLDNTQYGSVIYDLKGEDLARKNEIGTARFSDRDTESTDTRTLLANALLTSAQNDTERKYIADYQKSIQKINESQNRLAEVNAKIKELSFEKGTRDTEQIKALKEEAVKLANNINTYDKKLLRLEATKPLKNVISREKTAAKKKYEAKSKERLETYKEKSVEKQQKLVEYYNKRQEKAIDRYKTRATKREQDIIDKYEARLDRAEARRQALIEKEAEKREHLKEQHQKYVERVKEREQRLRDQRANSKEVQRQNRNAQEIKAEIKKIADELRQKLLNPNENKFIPYGLVNGVIDVCNAIDPTGRTYYKPGTHEIDVEKTREKYDETSKASEKFANTKQALLELKLQYDALEKHPNYDFSSEFNEEFSTHIGELADAVGNTPIREMTDEQLSDVYDILSDIRFMITSATVQIGLDERISNYKAGQEIISNMQAVKDAGLTTGEILKLFREWTLNPMRATREMSGFNENARLVKLFESLNEGRRKADEFRMINNKMFDALRQSKEDEKTFNDAVENASIEVRDVNGNPVMISKMQAMQAILTWEREQANPNRSHLETPVRFTDVALDVKGKYDDAHYKGHNVLIDENFINTVNRRLTDWDREYLDTAREFFRVISRNAINEVSLVTKHRLIALEEKYIPYYVNGDYIAKESENVKFDSTIEGMGMLKSVKQNAKQQLVIRGLNTVIADHMDKVAKVYGLAIPVRNWNKAFNVIQTEKDGGKAVKDAIGETWGKGGKDLLDQAVADLQSNRRTDSVKALNFVKSAFVTSVLASNISVTMKQAASYPTAGAFLSAKSLTKALPYFGKNLTSLYDEIDEHTSQHYIRRIGLSSQEIGEMNQTKGWQNKLNKKLGNFSPMNWIQSVDVKTTAVLWVACKNEVESMGISKSDENYWNEVTKLYDKVIEETQPMYDSLHRAEITKKAGLKNVIMFQTQPIQNSGILREGAMELKAAIKVYGKDSVQAKKASEKFVMAVGSQMASHFVFTAMTLLSSAILHKMNRYRDDDDEITIESLLAEFSKQFGENFFGALVPIIGSYAVSIAEKFINGSRYDVVSDPTVDKINETINNFVKLKNPSWDAFVTLATDIASYFSIPANNIYNIINGAKLHIEDAINGDFGSFESGVERTSTQDVHRSYNAYVSGDMDKFGSIEVDQSAVTRVLRPNFLEAYSNNDTETMANIRRYMKATKLYKNDVVEVTQGWIKNSKK